MPSCRPILAVAPVEVGAIGGVEAEVEVQTSAPAEEGVVAVADRVIRVVEAVGAPLEGFRMAYVPGYSPFVVRALARA